MGRTKCSAIERLVRFGRDRTLLLIVCIAGLSTAHIVVRTATYGPEITWDSTLFLSTALNFLAGEGWRDFIGEPLTLHPPLFPLLLAAGGWVGIDLLATGRWVNVTAFGLTILAAGCYLRSHLQSRWLVLAATALLAASLPLTNFAARLLTESLFFLFVLLALIQLAAFLNRRTAAPLWWAAVFTALATTTRYPGAVLIGTGVLILWPLARWKQTLVFGAVSSVPLLAVLVHNSAITGDLTEATGNRIGTTGQSLSAGLSQTIEAFGKWVVPLSAPDGLAYLLWLGAAALLWLGAAAVVLAGAVVILRAGRTQRSRRLMSAWGPVLPFGAFTAIYPVLLLIVVPFTIDIGISTRYLMPIYVPLVLTAALLLDRFVSIEASGRMRVVRYVVVSLVGLATLTHLGFSARQILRRIAIAQVGGFPAFGFNSARWQHSETMNYLRDNSIESTIYSNGRGYKYLTWFWNRTADPGKHRSIPESMGWTEVEAGAHIFWFEEFHYRGHYGYDATDLRTLSGMETVADLADGVVFRRTAYKPFNGQRHRARKQRYVQQLIQQADEQVVRAGWGVYRTGRQLIYRKQPCGPADVQAKFVLHVVPTDPADLPARRKRYGSDNLDFYFDERGFWHGDQCGVIVRLPAYPIDRIYIGQWISEEDRTLWEAEFPADP